MATLYRRMYSPQFKHGWLLEVRQDWQPSPYGDGGEIFAGWRVHPDGDRFDVPHLVVAMRQDITREVPMEMDLHYGKLVPLGTAKQSTNDPANSLEQAKQKGGSQ